MGSKRVFVQVLDGTGLEDIGRLVYTAYTSVQLT